MMPTREPLPPGSWVGVMGGGQLGRMFAAEARRMGYRVCVWDPTPDSPAGQLADAQVVASWDDREAAAEFARRVAVATYEFENVDAAIVEEVEKFRPVYPGSRVLRIAQHRIREKETLSAHGFPTTPFYPVRSAADLEKGLDRLGVPAVLKTATFGYDGKGQVVIRERSEAPAAFEALRGGASREWILEAYVHFRLELSVICARTAAGEIACYPPGENRHVNGILDVTVMPARVEPQIARRAQDLAQQVAAALELVGVLAVEMFLTPEGELLVNELAPRPHNSGHATLDACPTSQFEQLLRAIGHLPLGSTELYQPAAMANLLGDLWRQDGTPPDFAAALAEPGVRLHLYGKAEARPGRKMGHLCALDATADGALARVLRARRRLVGDGR